MMLQPETLLLINICKLQLFFLLFCTSCGAPKGHGDIKIYEIGGQNYISMLFHSLAKLYSVPLRSFAFTCKTFAVSHKLIAFVKALRYRLCYFSPISHLLTSLCPFSGSVLCTN